MEAEGIIKMPCNVGLAVEAVALNRGSNLNRAAMENFCLSFGRRGSSHQKPTT